MRAKKGGGTRVNPEPGVHIARLCQILDYGKQVDKFSPEGRFKVEFVWELPLDTHVFNEDIGPQPLLVDRKYGNTMGRGSEMKKAIESMLGQSVDKDFELDSLIGTLCNLNLSLEQDGEYENVVIQSFMPLTKEQAFIKGKLATAEQLDIKYPAVTAQFLLDLDNYDEEAHQNYLSLPQYKQDNIAKSETYAEALSNYKPAAKSVPSRPAATAAKSENVFAKKPVAATPTKGGKSVPAKKR